MDKFLGLIVKGLLLLIYAPIFAVIAYSFNSGRSPRRWEGFSFHWYLELIDDTRIKQALAISVKIGVISAGIATVIGLFTAIGLARYQFTGKKFVFFLIVLPIIVPEIVLGAALLSVYSMAHFKLGLISVILGHLIIALPLSSLIIFSALASQDPSLLEAAQDLGCNPFQYTTKILIPLIKTPMLAAFLLSFVTSFGNIVISTFTSGVGSTTIPIRVFSLLKTGITPEINALGALLVITTILFVLIIGVREISRITTQTN